VELDSRDRQRTVSKAFVRAVVEIGHRGLELGGQRAGVHCVAVVMRGDDYLACGQIHHGLIPTAVSVRQLIRLPSAGERQKLMPQADAEERLAARQAAQQLDRSSEVRRIARTGGNEHRFRIGGQNSILGRVIRDDRNLRTQRLELLQNCTLDAAVDQDDTSSVARAAHELLRRRDAGDERAGARVARELGQSSLRAAQRRVADGQGGPDRSMLAQRYRDGTRIGTDEQDGKFCLAR
jgi:hypothetical protein